MGSKSRFWSSRDHVTVVSETFHTVSLRASVNASEKRVSGEVFPQPLPYSEARNLLISAEASKLWEHEPYGKYTIEPGSNQLA